MELQFDLTSCAIGPDEDPVGSSTMVMVFAERCYGTGTRKFQPYWLLGVGTNSLDIDAWAGVLDDGADFDLRIDAGTETVVEGTVGIRYQFGSHWSVMGSALIQHRIADWAVVEQVSDASTTLNDYAVSGAYFGLGYSF